MRSVLAALARAALILLPSLLCLWCSEHLATCVMALSTFAILALERRR